MNTETRTVTFSLDAERTFRRVLFFWLTLEILLFLADVAFTYSDLVDLRPINRLFNMTREDGLGSLLAITQILFVSLTLWLIVLTRRRDLPRRLRFGWYFLAIFFTYLFLDDGAAIHERLGTAYEILAEDDSSADIPGQALLELFPSYPWQILFMPVFSVIGLYMLWFLHHAFDDRRNFRLVFDGLLLYATAVMLDFIEGLESGHVLNVLDWLKHTFDLRSYTVSHFNKTVEETIEMAGTTLIWVAFLRHFMQQTPVLELHFPSRNARPSS